jgi:hypothetical protein
MAVLHPSLKKLDLDKRQKYYLHPMFPALLGKSDNSMVRSVVLGVQ